MKYLIIYLLSVNALSLLLMRADKKKAQKGRRRIPEATLLGFAAIGGSVGALIGMYAFRHKTRHYKFTIGVPLLMLAQCLLVLYLIRIL